MRLLIQRVTKASVSIEGKVHATINVGLLVFLAIHRNDTEDIIPRIAKKLVELRIFSDDAGKMNLSVQDIQGEILVVSQFTLYANCKRGRRPDFIHSAPPEQAKKFYNDFISELDKTGLIVKNGIFAADMQIHLVNDGPVTIMLDSQELG